MYSSMIGMNAPTWVKTTLWPPRQDAFFLAFGLNDAIPTSVWSFIAPISVTS